MHKKPPTATCCPLSPSSAFPTNPRRIAISSDFIGPMLKTATKPQLSPVSSLCYKKIATKQDLRRHVCSGIIDVVKGYKSHGSIVLNKKTTNSDFLWRIFPFLATAIIVGLMLRHAENDPNFRDYTTFYFLFLPIVAIDVFCFINVACYGVQSSRNPHNRRLAERFSIWAKITPLMWISTFLIVAAIAITSIYIGRGVWSITEISQPESLSVGTTKHTVLNILDLAIRVLFVIPLVALVFAAICLAKSLITKKTQREALLAKSLITNKKQRKALYICILSFSVPILLIFVLGWRMRSVTRKEVKSFMAKTSPDSKLMIDGQQVKGSYRFISELSKVSPLAAHNSHATKRIRIDIESADDKLTLEVGQDNINSDEFWVFYPSFRHTRANEIGRIRSSLFEEYYRLREE